MHKVNWEVEMPYFLFFISDFYNLYFYKNSKLKIFQNSYNFTIMRQRIKNYLTVLFLLLSIIYFFSCSKKKDDKATINGPCSDFSSPYINNDGPVQMGSTLRL